MTSCITLHGLKHRQDSYSFISFKGNICSVFFAFINLFLHLCSAIFSTFIHAHSCISKSNIAKFSIVCVCVCVCVLILEQQPEGADVTWCPSRTLHHLDLSQCLHRQADLGCVLQGGRVVKPACH